MLALQLPRQFDNNGGPSSRDRMPRSLQGYILTLSQYRLEYMVFLN
jgi:hypothetical protein